MKTKITIFKVLAAVIAVGGALASASANSSVVATSVYVRYTTANTNNIYCCYVGTCDAGPNVCTARVQITGQPIITTTARATIPPNNNTCPTAIQYTHTSSSPINTTPCILPPDAVIK